MIWLTIKKYWKVAYSLLLSLGTFLLIFSVMQSGRRRREKKRLEAQAEHILNVMDGDIKIDREHDVRTEELAKEMKDKKASSELAKPNKEW